MRPRPTHAWTMFDRNQMSQFESAEDKSYNGSALPTIDHLDEGQLLSLLLDIESRLPPAKLAHMNMEDELVRQLQRAKSLQAKVLEDSETPANQKAQVMNSTASTIDSLIKMQERLYNAERFKSIEALIIEAMKSLPTNAAEKFLNDYEQLAG